MRCGASQTRAVPGSADGLVGEERAIHGRDGGQFGLSWGQFS